MMANFFPNHQQTNIQNYNESNTIALHNGNIFLYFFFTFYIYCNDINHACMTLFIVKSKQPIHDWGFIYFSFTETEKTRIWPVNASVILVYFCPNIENTFYHKMQTSSRSWGIYILLQLITKSSYVFPFRSRSFQWTLFLFIYREKI